MLLLGNLVKVTAAVWAAMSYARVAAAHHRPGAPRLAALLPVVALLYAIPFAFSTTTFRGSSAFFLTWLGVFKLLLLAAGRGPLDPSMTLRHFVCSASLPVKLRQAKNAQDPASSSRGRAPGKILLSGAVIPLIIYAYRFKDGMRRYQLLALYAVHIYLSLELLLAVVRAVIHDALGMEMEPQVDRPYLASSLRDFWGRRWNLMVPAILRPSVFRPVRASWRRCTSSSSIYYIMWRPPSGEVTVFFLLHGACTAAEAWWARHAGWWRPPRLVAVPLTVSFVAATGVWLFFPAMVKGGIDELVLQECQGMVVLMEQAARRLSGATDLIASTR